MGPVCRWSAWVDLTLQTTCTLALTRTQLNSGHFATWHSRGKSNSTIFGNPPTSSHLCASFVHESELFWRFGSSVSLHSSYQSPQHMWQKAAGWRRDGGSFKCQLESLKRFGWDFDCREERKSRPPQPFFTAIIEALFPQNTISVPLPQRRMTLNLAEFKCSPTCTRDRSALLAMTSPSISGIPRARRGLLKFN